MIVKVMFILLMIQEFVLFTITVSQGMVNFLILAAETVVLSKDIIIIKKLQLNKLQLIVKIFLI